MIKMIFAIHVSIATQITKNAKKFKCDTTNLLTSLQNLIHKGYDLATFVDSLMKLFFAG
jgi:phosphotransferase system HPr-like phosphotransfer protein